MKKNFFISTLLFGLCVVFGVESMAIPAYTGLQTKKQSNGKEISFYLQGDEFLSWAKTSDGYTILYNDGDFCYAYLNESGDMVASSIIASNPSLRSKDEERFVSGLSKDISYSVAQKEDALLRRRQRDNKYTSMNRIMSTGSPYFLVILVNFEDYTFSSADIDRWKHQIKDSNYTSYNYTGSVRDYYHDNSMGVWNPQFDVIGPITLPHNESYYGANGNYGNDGNAWRMAYDAVYNLDTALGIDFSQYDNDNDGYVDFVHIIYAGSGEHTTGNTDLIWPHAYYFMQSPVLDSKRFTKYSCSSELTLSNSSYSQVIDGIGAVCHELAHVFGIPDMYDTDYESSGGEAVHPGSWDIMASGPYNNNSKTPPYFSTIEKEMMHWSLPQYLEPGQNTLYPACDSNYAFKKHLNENEYIMLEYRNHDKWDAYTPAVGMLLWHADTSQFENWEQNNDVNASPDDRGCYIEPAYGDSTRIETTSVTFPGSRNVTSLNYFHLTDGTAIESLIADIHYASDSAIVFLYYPSLPISFTDSITSLTTTSADIAYTMSYDGTITERTFEYKKSNASTYMSIDLSADNGVINLANLDLNTNYIYRFFAKYNGQLYQSAQKTFHTPCADGAITDFPFVDGFENGLGCWTIENSDNCEWRSSSSAISTQKHPVEGSLLAEFIVTQSSYYRQSQARLISPVMDISNLNNPKLYFSYISYSSASKPLSVYYRANKNNSWTRIAQYSQADDATWIRDSVSLPNGSSTYQISFLAKDGYGYGVAVDNVVIKDSSNSALVDVEENKDIFVYPNPATDNLFINADGLEVESIVIVDNMGRIVVEEKDISNDRNIVVDTKNLTSGAYFVKLIGRENIIVKKFIKK